VLSKQRTQQAVRDSQQLAGRQQTRSILAWLDAQKLPARAQRLSRLREDAGELIAARLGVPILEGALPSLVNDPAYRLSIVDPVVTARMKHWPIVNVLHGLVAPIFMMVRWNIGLSAGGDVNIDDYLTVEGAPLPTMVQTTFAQARAADREPAVHHIPAEKPHISADVFRGALGDRAGAHASSRREADRALAGRSES